MDDASNRDSLELARATEAFDVGDYRLMKQTAKRLLGSEDAEIRAGAAELLKRVSVDPAQLVAVAFCVIFFVVVVWKYVF